MELTVEALLDRNLAGVFGERDAVKRRACLDEIWSSDGVFIDHNGRYVGRDAIDRSIDELHARFPDFVFTTLRPPEAMQGVGRVAWGFGPKDSPPVVKGVDILVTRDGMIEALYVFLDH